MDRELLKAFIAVAETEGFSAAANMLNRTQSAVSLQIKRLEERLGVQLFARTSRTVSLTQSGTRLLPFARQLLHLEQQARASIAPESPEEVIRFGLTEEHAAAYLPQILNVMARTHPGVQIQIVCAISSTLVEEFQNGKLDLVLAVRHEPMQTGRILGVEPMIWIASEDFDTPQSAPLPLALNPEGCIFRAHALAAIGGIGRSWREPYVSGSPTGINVAVQSGLAVTVKTLRSMPDGCVDIGERLGLPQLGLAEVEMHVSPAHIGDAFLTLVQEVDEIGRNGSVRSQDSPLSPVTTG